MADKSIVLAGADRLGNPVYVRFNITETPDTGSNLSYCTLNSIQFQFPYSFASAYLYTTNGGGTSAWRLVSGDVVLVNVALAGAPAYDPSWIIGSDGFLYHNGAIYTASFTVQHDTSGNAVLSALAAFSWGSTSASAAYPRDTSYGINTSASVALTNTKPVTHSLSISPGEVTAGSNVILTVAGGNGYNLNAVFSYNGTTLASSNFSTGTLTMPCATSWFTTAGISTLSEITVSVTVTGGTSTLTGSFLLRAGSSMAPQISGKWVSLVQGSAATAFDCYIATISKVKVGVAITIPSGGAPIDSISISYSGNGMDAVFNSSTGRYEATTPKPITGDTVFTITATDKRGLSNSSQIEVTDVIDYSPPAVVINEAYRCDSTGAQVSGGTYFRIKVTTTICSALPGNSLVQLNCQLKSGGSTYAISNGSMSGVLGSNSLQPKRSATIVVNAKDALSDVVKREITLEGQSRNFVMTQSDDGTYLGIGKTPERTSGPSAIELPSGGEFFVGGAVFSDRRVVLPPICYGALTPEEALPDAVEGQIYFQIAD